jgi:hypothetical protein
MSNLTPFKQMRNREITWKDVVIWYEEQLNELEIPDNILPSQIAHIDKMMDGLYKTYRKDMAYIEEMNSKIERMIKKTNIKGAAIPPSRTNEFIRKAAGVEAVENYEMIQDDGSTKTVNLYDLQDEYATYLAYFKYIGDIIDHKVGVLIRALGVNKIEEGISR